MMSPRDAISKAAGAAVLGAVVLLLVLTAWSCLVAGSVVLLRPLVGLGGALLIVAGAALVIVALILLVARLAGGAAPPRSASGSSELARSVMASVVGAVSSRSGRVPVRVVLIGVALLSAALAIYLPSDGRSEPDE